MAGVLLIEAGKGLFERAYTCLQEQVRLFFCFHSNRGQKPTDCGHLGREFVFALCFKHNKTTDVTCVEATLPFSAVAQRLEQEDFVWIRGILALVWLAAAIVSGGALYVILGMIFLVSAFSAWRQDKDGKGEKQNVSSTVYSKFKCMVHAQKAGAERTFPGASRS